MAGVVDRQSRNKVLSIVEHANAPDRLSLELTVEDRDTIDELLAYPPGDEREQFALNALRIGVLALRQARGRVDGCFWGASRSTCRTRAGYRATQSGPLHR